MDGDWLIQVITAFVLGGIFLPVIARTMTDKMEEKKKRREREYPKVPVVDDKGNFIRWRSLTDEEWIEDKRRRQEEKERLDREYKEWWDSLDKEASGNEETASVPTGQGTQEAVHENQTIDILSEDCESLKRRLEKRYTFKVLGDEDKK